MENLIAQGGGSIRQRPDGRWEARYTVGRDPDTGKQVQKSVYGATQAEVRKKLQQATTSIDEGVYTEPARLTLGGRLDIWLKEYTSSIKPATLNAYKGRIEYKIKPQMIQAQYNALQHNEKDKEALSPKSIANIHGILHKALQRAVELGY